jgi:hypothetical protein
MSDRSVEATIVVYVFRDVAETGLGGRVVILKLEGEESIERGVRRGKG